MGVHFMQFLHECIAVDFGNDAGGRNRTTFIIAFNNRNGFAG
jgi:hypothetical protein